MSNAVKSKLRRRLVVALFSIVILIAVLAIFAAPIVRYATIRYLESIDVTAEIEQVQINLLDGQFNLTGLSTFDPQKRRLSLDSLSVDWQWTGVLSQQFTLNGVVLSGLDLDVATNANQLVSIGPIELAKLAGEPQPKVNDHEQPGKWLLQLGGVELIDFDICYQDLTATIDQCVNWQSLDLATQLTVGAQQAPSVSGDVNLYSLQVAGYLALDQLKLSGLKFTDNLLSWIDLSLDNIQHPSEKTGAEVAIERLLLAEGEFNLAKTTGQLKTLSLAQVNGRFEQYAASLASIDINQVVVLEEQRLEIGDAALQSVEVEQATQPLATVARLTTKKIGIAAQTQQGSINDLQISTTKAYNPEIPAQLLADLAQLHVGKIEFDVKQQQASVGQLVLQQLIAFAQSSRGQLDRLLSVERLSLDKAQTLAGVHQIHGVELVKLGLMQDLEVDGEQMLVNIDKIDLDQGEMLDKVELGDLVISGLHAKLEQEPETGLNLASWLGASKEPQTEQATTEASQKPLAVYLKNFKLAADSELLFIDHSVTPAVSHKVEGIDLNLVGFALAPDAQPASLKLTGQIQGSGKLQATGQVNPNGENLFADINGKLQYLDLPTYSQYSARNIGHRINQGQLNVDFKLALKDNKIDSNFDLLLNKFEIDKLEQHEKSELNAELGVPLSTALDLLRDGDDNIELSLPIDGDLANPNFSMSGVLTTVTFKALKTAVLYTYSPLGLLSVAGGIVDLATALRFEPIEFALGDVTLSETAKARMDKAGGILKEKTKVSLILCANATKADLAPETAFSDELLPILLENAIARQKAVQSYLVETHGIEAHRLLMCNVKLDKKADAQPKVEIRL